MNAGWGKARVRGVCGGSEQNVINCLALKEKKLLGVLNRATVRERSKIASMILSVTICWQGATVLRFFNTYDANKKIAVKNRLTSPKVQ